MTIDPRVGFYLSVSLAVLGVLAGAGVQLTDLFGPVATKKILSLSVLLMTLGNAVNAVLHAIPSTQHQLKDFYLGSGKPTP